MLFLLLGKCNMSLCYTLSVVHVVGKLCSLLPTKRFTSVCRRFRGSLILGGVRLKPLKELKGAYSDALVVQGELGVVYHRD